MGKTDLANLWMVLTDYKTGKQKRVPVMAIAESRAAHYVDEFDGSLARSLAEDTIPLFESDMYEIQDWASNNMDFGDVAEFAVDIPQEDEISPDWQGAWIDEPKTFRTITTTKAES